MSSTPSQQELSNVRRRKLGNDDLHHFFQAGLVRGLPGGLLSYVFVMGKVRQLDVMRSVIPANLELVVGGEPVVAVFGWAYMSRTRDGITLAPALERSQPGRPTSSGFVLAPVTSNATRRNLRA